MTSCADERRRLVVTNQKIRFGENSPNWLAETNLHVPTAHEVFSWHRYPGPEFLTWFKNLESFTIVSNFFETCDTMPKEAYFRLLIIAYYWLIVYFALDGEWYIWCNFPRPFSGAWVSYRRLMSGQSFFSWNLSCPDIIIIKIQIWKFANEASGLFKREVLERFEIF